jgi:hypothetical protein
MGKETETEIRKEKSFLVDRPRARDGTKTSDWHSEVTRRASREREFTQRWFESKFNKISLALSRASTVVCIQVSALVLVRNSENNMIEKYGRMGVWLAV